MDKIQECAEKFKHLVESTSYIFHLARKSIRVVKLNFEMSDFHHLAGLQYLSDIEIPRNRKKTIDWILNDTKPVTDTYLSESEFYKGKASDEKDVQRRIEELCYLEEYLDEDNIIRIYSPKDGPNNNSLISCDYIIESQLSGSMTIVYIFLKHRRGIDSPCCINSFIVKKNVSYGGQNLYWMLKDKIVYGVRNTIFQHPKYTDEQKERNQSE